MLMVRTECRQTSNRKRPGRTAETSKQHRRGMNASAGKSHIPMAVQGTFSTASNVFSIDHVALPRDDVGAPEGFCELLAWAEPTVGLVSQVPRQLLLQTLLHLL